MNISQSNYQNVINFPDGKSVVDSYHGTLKINMFTIQIHLHTIYDVIRKIA